MVVSMERWVGKVAIVTGASAGIGAGIAKKLVEEGLTVVGLARRSERIEELAKSLVSAKGKLLALKCDMTVEEQILAAFKWTKENVGPVSILINNAGLIQPTNLLDGNTAMWKRILDTNILGLSIATREAIRQMREFKIDGHVVHINSISGHKNVYFPEVNMYTASKHAVTALTETLRKELNDHGLKIKITSVSPGTVTSEISSNFPADSGVEEKRNACPQISAEDVADSVVYTLSTNPNVQVHEIIIQPVGELF